MFLFLPGATHLGLHAIGIHAVHPATATKDVGLSRSTLYLYFNKENVKFKGEKGPIKPRPLQGVCGRGEKRHFVFKPFGKQMVAGQYKRR